MLLKLRFIVQFLVSNLTIPPYRIGFRGGFLNDGYGKTIDAGYYLNKLCLGTTEIE
jgi:hypothetical protein